MQNKLVLILVLMTLNSCHTSRSHSTSSLRPEVFLTAIAMFKNEELALKEWIKHHRKQGVDRFVLINNGSTDNFRPQIEAFIQDKTVILIDDDKKAAQVELLNKYFQQEIKYQSAWVVVIDLDEFLYARKGYKNIPEYLRKLSMNISQVTIPWKMFGSNNKVEQPNSIIAGFTKRGKVQGVVLGKSITRVDKVRKIHVHASDVIGTSVDPLHRKIDVMGNVPFTEDLLKTSPLHLNHYHLQSENWYWNVKMKRGDVYYQNRAKHNEDFFRERNAIDNQIIDDELLKLTQASEESHP